MIVDDGSTDGTRELLATRRSGRTNVTLVFHDRNRGKGAALRTGLQHATGEWAAILDADLEYRASDLGPLLEPLLDGEAQRRLRHALVVEPFGVQLLVRDGQQGRHARDERDLQLLDLGRDDLPQGDEHGAVPLAAASGSAGFAIEPEIAARVLRAGERIYEVPITYKARSREEGKKLTALDGLRVLKTLVRCRID